MLFCGNSSIKGGRSAAMKILLIGKTGVFDTLAVAYGCLNQNDIHNCPYFGDLTLENNKNLVGIGADSRGNELFVAGFKVPKIISKINQEIECLSNIDPKDCWQVIPIAVKGENITGLLAWLAQAPLFGAMFLKWARARTLNRSSYLLEFGRNICLEKSSNCKDNSDLVIAAKPHRMP
jgi:hypothetical protein